MKKILDKISEILVPYFAECGYDGRYARVTISNRPDLCEYQCNGAMAASKEYHKAPIVMAEEIVTRVNEAEGGNGTRSFSMIEAVKPGFINMKLSDDFIKDYMNEMYKDERLGYEAAADKKTIVVDYGGANVAKPLHIGHLRSAVIGESVKRICRYAGHHVIGDVHLGDWGLQMGLIIEELHDRQPDLPYFDQEFQGEYPEKAPFTISQLEEIYPAASAKSKTDEAFRERAQQATVKLQNGDRAYTAIWKHIMSVSLADLKKNYDSLNVAFDLWKGESDAQPYIADMVQKMIEDGFVYESQGAMVVDVALDTDSKEIPPCIVRKSDGAALYATSDLATIVQREQDYKPDKYIYLADKRQELHFTQVFRAAKKTGLVKKDADMVFLGFGTMNGKDGKPFKTREGGVMRLEVLIQEIQDAVSEKIQQNAAKNQDMTEAQMWEIARTVGLAALKYGDLSNQASKDYVFDVERFSSFEGNTGPYILYNIVRIKSILAKYVQAGGVLSAADHIQAPVNDSARTLMLELARFNDVMTTAFEEIAPHKICQYIYGISDAFSSFYNNTRILAEEDEERRKGYIALLLLTRRVLEQGVDLLGFEAPEKM